MLLFFFSATIFGRGVYFAKNESYSCQETYSPPDPSTGFRYMYYARVLVGEYTNGNAGLLVAPNKGTGNRYKNMTRWSTILMIYTQKNKLC